MRILVKKTLGNFVFANDFVLEKTWLPYEYLENLADPSKFPHGKLYVLGGRMGDTAVRSRNNLVGPREYGTILGFQIVPNRFDDDVEIDRYISFVEEIEDVCRKEVNLSPFSFNRTEFVTDANGQPLDFIVQRKAKTFEAYFTAYYQKVRV